MTEDMMKFLAAWQLVHELADEGLKAAIKRGTEIDPDAMTESPDAFVDGLSAMVAEEKERLKQALVEGERISSPHEDMSSQALEEVRFEVGELRSRLETIETALDTILRRLDSPGV